MYKSVNYFIINFVFIIITVRLFNYYFLFEYFHHYLLIFIVIFMFVVLQLSYFIKIIQIINFNLNFSPIFNLIAIFFIINTDYSLSFLIFKPLLIIITYFICSIHMEDFIITFYYLFFSLIL